MSFALKGSFDGDSVEIRWNDATGSVECDDNRVMEVFRYRAWRGHRVWVTPTGPIIVTKLDDDLSVYVNAIDLLDAVDSAQGIEPVRERLLDMMRIPPGAVA